MVAEVEIDSKIYRELEKLAKREGKTVERTFRDLLEQYIKRKEGKAAKPRGVFDRCYICGRGIQRRSVKSGKAETNFKGLSAHVECMRESCIFGRPRR
jgi:metal-responsive CopG/Arc/MetJ family transcriptional regulator